jgi:hypothetical protein
MCFSTFTPAGLVAHIIDPFTISQYQWANMSAPDRRSEWAGHLLSPIPFSDIDSVDYYVFLVGSKPSHILSYLAMASSCDNSLISMPLPPTGVTD